MRCLSSFLHANIGILVVSLSSVVPCVPADLFALVLAHVIALLCHSIAAHPNCTLLAILLSYNSPIVKRRRHAQLKIGLAQIGWLLLLQVDVDDDDALPNIRLPSEEELGEEAEPEAVSRLGVCH